MFYSYYSNFSTKIDYYVEEFFNFYNATYRYRLPRWLNNAKMLTICISPYTIFYKALLHPHTVSYHRIQEKNYLYNTSKYV